MSAKVSRPDPNARTVAELMSTKVLTLARNDKLSIAADVMNQERIRHLPVLDDDGELCGIVSQRDLFRGALLRALGYGSRAEDMMMASVLIKEVMTESPTTVPPNTPLSVAAQLMIENQIGCLPVIDGDQLVGVLTEGDFVRLVLAESV